MKQFHHRIVGLRTDLVDSSSLTTFTASKSENEDSFWGDCTVDLSFLSSDDQRSALDDDDSLSNLSRDVDTTKERELFCAKKAVLSEKHSTQSDQDDDSEDIPCWIGLLSNNNLASGAKSVTSRCSVDDLSGFYRLNPLAPHFVPSSSKKSIDTNGIRDEEGNSSSLKKSLSSDFPSSSGEFTVTDPLEDGESILTNSELQTTKKLDPLAPVFVPASAKLSPLVNEKQGAFDTTSALASPDSKLVETCSREVGRSIKIRYPDGVNGFAKLGSSSNNSRRLNPLAPQFSLADTKPKAYGFTKSEAGDDLSLNNRFVVEPNTTLSVNNSMDFKLPLPFHVVETGSSSNVTAFSGYGQGHHSSVSSPSPKVDVKKLLTTMHGLSELLTFAHGSDATNAQELYLVNSTVQNLNSYVKSNIQEQAGTQNIIRHNSYDIKLSPNKSKLSIRDLQVPRKEKYSMVSGGTVPDSRLCEYVETENNNFGQVVATNGYQQDHRQGEEQIHPHALFYKSLWLKAEADRCLMVTKNNLKISSINHFLRTGMHVTNCAEKLWYCLDVEPFGC